MDLQKILYFLPGVIIGLTVHEFCHAYSAYLLGDTTAKEQGRLTFNPLKHIDIIGFLFIIFAGFGWAKPVEFNPENLRNLRRDKAIIAAAGPVSNLILGIIFCLFLKAILYSLDREAISFSVFTEHIFYIFLYAASVNFGLFIFNLLPVPPLDGSHIVFSGLNLSVDLETKIRKIGIPVLFLIIIIQNQLNITILPVGIIVDALLKVFL